MKTKWIIIGLLIFLGLGAFGVVKFFVNDAVKVAKTEFSPTAMLRKYEWFKDCSSQLDKKLKDVSVYEQNIHQMEIDYEGIKRPQWDRTDKEQFNQWRTELVGVKASYNGLAAEYNSQSSKFNWNKFEGEIPIEYAEILN